MGATLSKDEAAVVKLLQHILSTRGHTYDLPSLKALLSWARGKGFFPDFSAVFDTKVWTEMGNALWEEVATGSKEAFKHAALWKLIIGT